MIDDTRSVKLSAAWQGPFIVDKKSPLINKVYYLKTMEGKPVKYPISVTRMAPWKDREEAMKVFDEVDGTQLRVEEDVDLSRDMVEPASLSEEGDASDAEDQSLQTNELRDRTYEPSTEELGEESKNERTLRSDRPRSRKVKMRRSVIKYVSLTELVDS